MSVPNSTISVCSGVRLNNRYEHTYYWESRDAQSNFFATKRVREYTNYSFIRKTRSIKIGASYDFARTWDYLYFTNYRTDGAPGKTYYCFITSVEYIGDGVVEVFFEVDVMQTYALDYELLRCFVEREHTATDGIGEHTVEESLELGDLTTIMSEDVSMGNLCILIMSTIDIEASIAPDLDEPVKFIGSYIDRVFNGVGIIAVDATEWQALATCMSTLDSKGFSDGIVAMWMYPKKLVELQTGYDWSTAFNRVKGITPFFHQVSRPTVLDNGYRPRNKKLYTYPFNQLYISNNTGGSASFRWERFGDMDNPNFKITGAVSPQAHVRLYPMNYNGESHAYEHGLSLEGFPTCAWDQDVYKLWLAQNQNQHTLGMIGAGAGLIGGIATTFVNPLAGAGMIAGSAGTIAHAVAQKRDMQAQPPQARGSYSTSVNTSAGFQTFTFKGKCVSEEYARIIDSYFDLYGYQVNEVKVPSRCNRKVWTYVKTAGCHIEADFASEDAKKIESIFDNGITFWRTAGLMGYYNDDNTPL